MRMERESVSRILFICLSGRRCIPCIKLTQRYFGLAKLKKQKRRKCQESEGKEGISGSSGLRTWYTGMKKSNSGELERVLMYGFLYFLLAWAFKVCQCACVSLYNECLCLSICCMSSTAAVIVVLVIVVAVVCTGRKEVLKRSKGEATHAHIHIDIPGGESGTEK